VAILRECSQVARIEKSPFVAAVVADVVDDCGDARPLQANAVVTLAE
jgi:hypothetical protein